MPSPPRTRFLMFDMRLAGSFISSSRASSPNLSSISSITETISSIISGVTASSIAFTSSFKLFFTLATTLSQASSRSSESSCTFNPSSASLALTASRSAVSLSYVPLITASISVFLASRLTFAAISSTAVSVSFAISSRISASVSTMPYSSSFSLTESRVSKAVLMSSIKESTSSMLRPARI